ncbi:MAG: hypothetical protein AAFR20_05210 [Pseudomonadota bacterium]
MNQSLITLALLAVAGTTGAIMGLRLFQQKPSPVVMAVLHALFVIAGLFSLASILAGGTGGNPLPAMALGLYIIAAIGGFMLMSSRFTETWPKRWVIASHGGFAALGTTLVAIYALS